MCVPVHVPKLDKDGRCLLHLSPPYSLDRGSLTEPGVRLGWRPANLTNLPISSLHSTEGCKAQLVFLVAAVNLFFLRWGFCV